MNIDSDTASTSPEPPSSPQTNVEAWSPPPSTWPSNAAPTSTLSNPTEQFQHYGQMAAWSGVSVSETCMRADLFPRMQPSSSYVNPQEAVASDMRSVARVAQEGILGFGNGNSIDTWSPLQSNEPNSAVPMTYNQYSPIEQIQNYGQTAVWSVDSPSAASDMADTFPGLQPSGSHMNPQEVVPSETRYATASEPPCSSVDTRYSQHSTWPTNVAKPIFTQFNQIKQIQDYGQTTVWSSSSPPLAPYVEPTQVSGAHPFNGNMIPLDVGHSEARCAVGVEQKGSFGPENGIRKKRTLYNEQTTSTLEEHYLENPYPSTAEKKDLAKQTGLTMMQIGVWFCNRRYHDRVAGVEIENPWGYKNLYIHKRAHPIFKKHYLEDRYPNVEKRKDLADQTGLTEKQVHCWFNNRRKSDRAAEAKKTQNFTDAGYNMEATQTGNSENMDPTLNQWKLKPTLFDEGARSTLKKFYLENPLPSLLEKKMLANLTGLMPKQVEKWFNTRRYRAKKRQHGNATGTANRHDAQEIPSEDSDPRGPKSPCLMLTRTQPLIPGHR